jgi:hypothetical protein
MQWNMQALISLSDAILKEQTHNARVSLRSDFKLGLRVPDGPPTAPLSALDAV